MAEEKKRKAKMIQHVERCKECGYCVRSCPVEALSCSDVVYKKGYPGGCMDVVKCPGCAIGYTGCPDNVFERVED